MTPTCTPASGSTFALGTTEVTCTATDRAGNTRTKSFGVTVRDTTAPTLDVPDPITAEATGPNGARVVYLVTTRDAVDNSVRLDCDPASNTVFPLGTTTVTCTATDFSGNHRSNDFTVKVRDTTGPGADVALLPVGPGYLRRPEPRSPGWPRQPTPSRDPRRSAARPPAAPLSRRGPLP